MQGLSEKEAQEDHGAGAAGGALIGGLAGGGAAIGALLGGGVGFVGGAFTGNKQIQLPARPAQLQTECSADAQTSRTRHHQKEISPNKNSGRDCKARFVPGPALSETEGFRAAVRR